MSLSRRGQMLTQRRQASSTAGSHGPERPPTTRQDASRQNVLCGFAASSISPVAASTRFAPAPFDLAQVLANMLRTDSDMRRLEQCLKNAEAFYQEVSGLQRQSLQQRRDEQGEDCDIADMLAKELTDADRMSTFRHALQRPAQFYLSVFNKRPGSNAMGNRARGPMIRIQREQASKWGGNTNTGRPVLHPSPPASFNSTQVQSRVAEGTIRQARRTREESDRFGGNGSSRSAPANGNGDESYVQAGGNGHGSHPIGGNGDGCHLSGVHQGAIDRQASTSTTTSMASTSSAFPAISRGLPPRTRSARDSSPPGSISLRPRGNNEAAGPGPNRWRGSGADRYKNQTAEEIEQVRADIEYRTMLAAAPYN